MRNIEDFKILVVDDSPELIDLTVMSLKKEHYKVFTASNGTECMKVLHDSKPDIILLDVMLPDSNGFDLSRKIKNDPEFSTVFIILLSAVRIHPEHISEGFEKGADGYIVRPVGSRELLARVKAACRTISAEKMIRSDHLLLQACLDSPEDMIILALDKQYNYLAFNAFHQKTMLQSYGVKVKSGMNILECITNKEDIIRAKANYDRALAGESHHTIEEYGGLNREYYETRYNPIYNERKEIIGVTAFANNVSEKKLMEESLKKSEEKFRKAFITSPDSININRLTDGMYISINEGFTKITGYSEKEIVGKTSIELNIWADLSDRDKLVKGIKANGKVENLETTFKTKNGSLRKGMMSAALIDLDGVPHILSMTRDVTERKKAEEELKERTRDLRNELENKTNAEKELQKSLNQLDISRLATLNLLEDIKVEMEQRKKVEEEVKKLNADLEIRVLERTSQFEEANKELEAFAYSVSHDLRAPLRAIDGFSKFVLEDYGRKLDKEGQRLLGLIRNNTQKMDQLITDILTLSRVTRSEHKVSKVDMTKMALSMLNEAVSPEIMEKLCLKIDELPEAYADSTYMKQVWINLISNAVKFSSLKKKQVITIGGFNREGFHVYYVKDNGVGFNPEYAHKLFGVFQRLHKSDDFEGTGVGLAIVQRIIHRHGGKVWAEGKEGKGATFYFSLPAKSAGQA